MLPSVRFLLHIPHHWVAVVQPVLAKRHTPPRRNLSPFQPPPLCPLILTGFRKNTPSSAQILTGAIAEEIRLLIPARLQLCEEWKLVYSLEQDGVSLATLYKNCEELRGKRIGFVLVVRDSGGGVSSSVWTSLRELCY